MKFSRALVLASVAVVCASGQTPAPTFSTGQAARLVIGQTNFTTADFGSTNILLGSPSGIAYANGTLWVADANRLGSTPNNNRVLRFSDAATYPSPVADPTIPGSTCGVCRGQASLVLGQPDFITNNSSLQATGLRSPTGVATDGNVLAVADTDNNRVLIWLSMPRANGQPADVVIGQTDFTHNSTSVPPTATSLRGPSGLWIANGKLFVADTQDNRILIYNKIPTSNHAAADVVIGQPNFTSFVQPDLTQATATPAPNNMQTPIAVSTDGQRMFVADLGQNRVLIWNTIPSTNGAPADIALGQPDLFSAIDNNSYKITNATPDAAGYPTTAVPVLCQSNGTDTAGNAIFPVRCAATMSFPRYALSDGKRLFVADGGNDRVLVYNTIPTASGQPADVILGQPDEFSDNTGQNPNGSDAFQTPVSLAWDGVNLYVGDTYNRRVVVYSPGVLNIPLAAVRNAASQQIYAIGSVSLSGNIVAKDTITITINGTAYTYTIVAGDTPTTITDALVKLINKAPDPNVTAAPNDVTSTVVLTARTPGQPGAAITIASSSSTGAQILGTPSGTNLNIYLQNPTQIAPGTVIEVNGTNLCDDTAAVDAAGFSQTYLPTTLAGCELFVDGLRAPLLYVSPTQINAQMGVEFVDRTSVSVYARSKHADGSITVTSPIAVTIVLQNPGIFADTGTDPRPGFVYHAFSNANDLVSIDGLATAGDVVTLTIGDTPYTYTVTATDTLATIRDALVGLINSAPDPNVIASAANEYQRLLLVSRVPGPDGEGVTVSQTVTGKSPTEIVTVFNSTLCCASVEGSLVTPDNPAIPGEILYVLATGLGPTNPSDVDTGRIYRGDCVNPPATLVDSILTGGTTANVVNVCLVPGTVGIYKVQFELSTGLQTDPATQLTIAQQAFVSNVVTFPVAVPAAPAASIRSTPAASKRRPAARRN